MDMELKDQILQTKERKKGFMKAMPEETRKQVNTYTKLEKIAKNFWIIIVAALVISVAVYLVACFAATNENRFVVHAILAGLWVVAGILLAFWIKGLAQKCKKAISLGIPDYVEELNAINARLAGLESAEKQRLAAEKEDKKTKALDDNNDDDDIQLGDTNPDKINIPNYNNSFCMYGQFVDLTSLDQPNPQFDKIIDKDLL